MESGHKQIILKVPKHIQPVRNNKETVGVDEEIVDTIKHLWKNKIITLGCCQGIKGSYKGTPNLIIEQGYKEKDILKIKKLIKEVDNRDWTILQWRLDIV
jgi:hypothetical protein